MKKICVFCGSSKGNNPIYREFAEKLGKYMSANSVSLVYGGGNIGLMGILSKSVMQSGGYVTGIIPDKLYKLVPQQSISELIVVPGMHERKARMYEMSDGFICLPGGIGSLDELVETLTWLQLGYHSKPVCLLNINGFYSNLLNQFELMVNEGFLKRDYLSNLIIRDRLDGIFEAMFSKEIVNDISWKVHE